MSIKGRLGHLVSGRYSVAIVMVLLLASMFSMLVPSARAEINPPIMISPGFWETPGTWVIEPGDYVIHGNKTINVNGNLVIQDQGTLVLYAVGLVMNNTLPGEFFIEVQPGGSLLVYDGGDGFTPQDVADTDPSYVMSPDPMVPFRFYIRSGGTFLLNRSYVLNCGMPPAGNPSWGDNYGIYSESDLTVVEDSVIRFNGVGLIANHSKATIARSWIYDSGYGVVGAENALIEFTDGQIIWSAAEGVFLNSSRMYLNYSFIARNGFGPGVSGMYAYRDSTLMVDSCDVMQNAGNGALSVNSMTSVTNSWIFQNGGSGLAWASLPGEDIVAMASNNWIEDHSIGLRVMPSLGAGDSHVEFFRNNITLYNRGTYVTGVNVSGNFSGNTLWSGGSGLAVDGDSVDMDISKNYLDDHMEDGIQILSITSGVLNLEMNTINNGYGTGARGIYIEPQQFADVSVANNTITNVSDSGIAVYSPAMAGIVAWAYGNRIFNSSTDCGGITCGAMYFYATSGDIEVYAYYNAIDTCNDVGILAFSDLGGVYADIRYNTISYAGLMPMFWPASILVLANSFIAYFDISNNTITDSPAIGIVPAGWAGASGSMSGNDFFNLMWFAMYAIAGDGDVDLDCSNNTGTMVGGILYSEAMSGDGKFSLYGNVFSSYVDGVSLQYLMGNLTLNARFNDMSQGDYNAFYVLVDGWVEAWIEGNSLMTSFLDSLVHIASGGQVNLTLYNNGIYDAALDGVHLEAPSANMISEWNYFSGSRVNFNATIWDPYGHFYVDSYFDFLTYSTTSFAGRVYVEGTSDMFWQYLYSLGNVAEVEFVLNRTSDLTISRGWINGNSATGMEIWHNFEQLNLNVESSGFRENQRGLFVVSSSDAVITMSDSDFNANTQGTGAELFIMGNLSLSTSYCEFAGNSGSGLAATAMGDLYYLGRDDLFAVNEFDGLYVSTLGMTADYAIAGSDFIGNALSGGAGGAMLDVMTAPWANVSIADVRVIGNNQYGLILMGGSASISDTTIQGHDFGIMAFNINAVVESSDITMNNNSMTLPFSAHFVVFNSTLSSSSLVDFILDSNSSLWGINTTFNINNGMFLDSLSWAQRSWFTDILVITNSGTPLAGALVNANDLLGTTYINATTGLDGYLWTNLVDDQWRNFNTAIHHNSYDITADAIGIGSTWVNWGFYAYSHVVLMIWDIDAPIANAGSDQIVDEDTTVQFDGTGSTDNVKILSYEWTFVDQGFPQTLYGPTPTYVFAEPGIYAITLTVQDGSNPPASDQVQITVLDVTGPTAEAGPDQNVPSGTTVMFDGSGSFDNVGVVNYTWTFTHNATPVTLYGVSPSYQFWTPGSYVVILNVRDNASNGGADNMVVTVFDADPPIADPGPDQIVDEDTVVVFDGSGSTDNIGIVSYVWTFIEGTNIVTLMGVSPTYVFTEPGVYAVTLTVKDATGAAAADTMTVTVLDATPPIVIFSSPYDGATDQPLSTSVVIGFSETMDTASVEAVVTISSGAQITGFNWNTPQDDTVTITLSNLTYSSMYVVNIDPTATDASGIPMAAAFFFNFMTTASAGPDVIPPEIIYAYPEDAAVDVPIAIVLKVVFSEPMNTVMTEGAILVDGAAPLGFNWLSNNTLVEITVAPFPYSTVHTLSVSTAAADEAGNPLSTSYNIAFTTEDPPAVDVIAPEIIHTNPENGELGVPVTASVFIVFSEPMNTASVEAAVSIDQGATIAAYVWTYGDTVLELQLSGVVQGILYTVTVTTGAEDLAGNPMSADYVFQYTTFAPGGDTTRPVILYTFPDDGETDISVSTSLVMVFSEPMNTTSVEAAINISGVTPIGFQWTSGDTTVEIFLPMLSYSTSYLVNIGDSAADLAGNTIFEPYLVMFQTEAIPGVDTTRPYVTISLPTDGTTDVAVSTTVVIFFSEPMNTTSVEASLQITGATITGFTWTSNNTRVEVSLQTLVYSTSYDITIIDAATDLAGNQMYPWAGGFTTEDQPGVDTTPPEVVLVYPDDGDSDVAVSDGEVVIVIVFNEPMDESSVEGALSISDGTLSGHQWSQDSMSLTVVLSGVEYDTDYTLTIGSGAEDLAGNALTQEVVDFTTMAEPEGPAGPAEEFDISQAWWLILIIIVLIVVIVLLLLMKRRPPSPETVGEPTPEEEVPELEELITEEPAGPMEPPAPEEPLSDEDITVY